ncbi:DUF6644 family protein [Ancylobacter terrae]|uniref:DUF6644 family protein n=1 Tax=Ancylobacter sp. sgz301288 TaxID=3342077 RepID=UPI0038597DA0
MEHGGAAAAGWALALQQSALGAFVRDSLWIYPAANLVHLLGLTLLIGPIIVLDLRLLGVGRGIVSAAAASRLLTPFALAGIVLLLPSGVLLFAADAASLASSPLFQIKLALVGLALFNALAFRRAWNGRLADWDRDPPLAGRWQAGCSIGLWLAAGFCGRMIAYL